MFMHVCNILYNDICECVCECVQLTPTYVVLHMSQNLHNRATLARLMEIQQAGIKQNHPLMTFKR